QVLLTDTHTFSSNVLNDLRVNYTFGRFTRNFPPGFDASTGRNFSTEIGLPSLTAGGLPEFITGGGSIGWSQSQQNENAEHTYNIANTTSWVRRNQTWKFGFDLLQQRLKTLPMFGASGGRYEFNRNRTLTSMDGTNTIGAGGTEFAQFLLGVYNQTTLRASLTGQGRNPSPDFASGTTTYTFDTRVADPNFVARICCNGPQWIPKSPEQVLNIPPDGLLYLDGINVAANAVSPNARVPYMHSWSTSVAYQLPWRMAVEVSYLGS